MKINMSSKDNNSQAKNNPPTFRRISPFFYKEQAINWENFSLREKFTNLFRGRMGRKHYAVGLLFAPVLLIPTSIILVPLFSLLEGFLENLLSGMVLLIYLVFILSLHIRRLHDLGDSGWHLLLFFIPVVNFLFFLYLLFSPGEKEENEYGKQLEKAGLFDILLNRF